MDTSKLNREQKEELLKLLQQKALLLKEDVLTRFEPHTGQQKFLSSPARIRAAFSGNGFGKTTALTIDLIWAHTRRHPHRNTDDVFHSWLLIKGFDKVEDYWSELKRWCPPSLLPKPNKMGTSAIKRLEWTNGTTTTFYSHDQDSGKLEGTNLDALYCDEPPPQSLWIAAYRGLRNNPNYYVVIAGTPISDAWMYEEIYVPGMGGDPNICIVQGSTYDNPHLSQEWVADFEKRVPDDERAARIHGEFKFLQGRVFKEFNRREHVLPAQTWPSEWPVYCAIDPHPRKPHTVVYVGVTPDEELCVIDEISLEGTPEDLAEEMRRKETENGYKIVARRIDNSGSGTDWSRDSFVTMLDQWSRENSYNVRVSPMRKAEKDVAQSIQKMKLLLKQMRLKFLETAKHTIRDMELFAWADHRNPEKAGIKEQPKKVNDDFIDPLRYIIASNPVHSPVFHAASRLGNALPYQSKLSVHSKPPVRH